jgi:hypothetical protein
MVMTRCSNISSFACFFLSDFAIAIFYEFTNKVNHEFFAFLLRYFSWYLMLYQIGELKQAEMKSILGDGSSLKFQSHAIPLKKNQRKLALDVLHHPEYCQLSLGQFSQHLFSYDCSDKIAYIDFSTKIVRDFFSGFYTKYAHQFQIYSLSSLFPSQITFNTCQRCQRIGSIISLLSSGAGLAKNPRKRLKKSVTG